jgi:hypothetical protein
VITKLEFVVSADEDASSFDDCLLLQHEVTFFVPSTLGPDTHAPELAAEMLEYIEEELARAYGGVTGYEPARGGWMSDAVGMVREGVTPVTVYVEELTQEVKAHLFGLVRSIKNTMRQESVLLVVDGKGRLY